MKAITALKNLFAWRPRAEAAVVPAAPSIHPALLRAAETDRVNLRLALVAASGHPVCLASPARADDKLIAFQLGLFARRCSHQPRADVLTPVEAAVLRLARAPRYLTRRLMVVTATRLPEDQKRLARLGAASSDAGVKLDLVLIGDHRDLGYLATLQTETLAVARTAPETDAAIRSILPAATDPVAATVILESSAAMRADLGGRSIAAIVAAALLRSLPRPAAKAAAPLHPQLQAA